MPELPAAVNRSPERLTVPVVKPSTKKIRLVLLPLMVSSPGPGPSMRMGRTTATSPVVSTMLVTQGANVMTSLLGTFATQARRVPAPLFASLVTISPKKSTRRSFRV